MTAPRFAYATPELALVARDLRDQRAAGDPKLVTKGRLTATQAADRLRIADAIATDWTAYAAGEAPPLPSAAADAEKRDTLSTAHTVTAIRAEKMRRAMLAEGSWLADLSLTALWNLVDGHHPLTHHIRLYLDREGYAAALEALLWWQDRPRGVGSKRWIVETNAAWRARGAGAQLLDMRAA